MIDDVNTIVDALIGIEREICEHGTAAYPVDGPMEWGDWKSHKRYEWAALLTLKAGNVPEAQVLATLANASAMDAVGWEIFTMRGEAQDGES